LVVSVCDVAVSNVPGRGVMRVLFTTQPGIGHLYPLLPIGVGLRGRGHDVAFASSASFAAEIEAAGFDAFAAGRDWLAVEMARAFPEMTSIWPG
jgi:UDP:flavonoid glycosyltransferase YjiC (YdhE family)